MKRDDIEKQIEQIRPQVDALIKKEIALKEQLSKLDCQLFEEFLVGKKFAANISNDYKRIYLVNSEFSIKEMSLHGANDYHQRFHIEDNVATSVDDGNINISSTNFSKLIDFIEEYKLIVDWTEVFNQQKNLMVLMKTLQKIEDNLGFKNAM